MDHIGEQGRVSEFHNDLVHIPIFIKEAMKIPGAKQPQTKNGTTRTCWPGTPRKQSQRRQWLDKRKRWNICSFLHLLWICATWKMRNLRNISNTFEGELCFGMTTSRTTKDTGQSWTRSISFTCGSGKIFGYKFQTSRCRTRTTQYPHTHSRAQVGSSQIGEMTGEFTPANMDTARTWSRTAKLGYDWWTSGSWWPEPTRPSFGRSWPSVRVPSCTTWSPCPRWRVPHRVRRGRRSLTNLGTGTPGTMSSTKPTITRPEKSFAQSAAGTGPQRSLARATTWWCWLLLVGRWFATLGPSGVGPIQNYLGLVVLKSAVGGTWTTTSSWRVDVAGATLLDERCFSSFFFCIWHRLSLSWPVCVLRFLLSLCVVRKAGKSVGHYLSERDRCWSEGGVLSLVSAVCGDIFQVMDVPVLVMCPCRREATSPASHITEQRKSQTRFELNDHSLEGGSGSLAGSRSTVSQLTLGFCGLTLLLASSLFACLSVTSNFGSLFLCDHSPACTSVAYQLVVVLLVLSHFLLEVLMRWCWTPVVALARSCHIHRYRTLPHLLHRGAQHGRARLPVMSVFSWLCCSAWRPWWPACGGLITL